MSTSEQSDTMAPFINNLIKKTTSGSLCKAFGIRLVTNPQIVQLAQNSGFDALFIDLEHSNLSLQDAGSLVCAGLDKGITPFVRVPHQCGNGFVQRVLDAGAMGIIFPHIHDANEARAAVSISKYPSSKDRYQGCRSMTGQLPFFSLKATPLPEVIDTVNKHASSVLLMIETRQSIENIDEIASVEGVDILLVGTNDLSIEIGTPGDFRSPEFRSAMETVSKACQKHGKTMGMAGIYGDKDIHEWAIHRLKIGFMLCQQDSGIISLGAARCAAEIEAAEKGTS